MKEVFIFGKGGHAKVVIDIIEKLEGLSVRGVIDKDVKNDETFLSYPVYPESEISNLAVENAVVGIGSGKVRKIIMENNKDLHFISLVHPSAEIGKDVIIEDGVVVMAGVVVNPCTILQKGSLVNTKASIDHDCQIGEYTSISPGATLGGGVRVGSLTSIGIGTSIIQLVEIGNQVIIGAGSVVLKSIPSGKKAFGCPCKVVN